MRRSILASAIAVGVLSAAPAAHGASVTIIHGIPGFVADVYVNGQLRLEGFQPGTITDALELPAGGYRLALREGGSPPASRPALTGALRLSKDANVSVVGHLNAAARPALTVYRNDVSPLRPGQTRIVARNTAATPPVDVVADGRVLFRALPNAAAREAELRAGNHRFSVRATRGNARIWGPVNLRLESGTAHYVYAIGSRRDNTLDLLVQNVEGLATMPGGVPAGTGPERGQGEIAWPLAGVLAGAFVVAGAASVRRRRLRA